MGDTWLLDHDRCAQRGQKIIENIHQRNKSQKGSSAYTKENAYIRTDLRQFSQDLNALRQDLLTSPQSHNITQREIERRQTLLDKLTDKEKQLELAFKNEDSSLGHRSALLDPGPGGAHADTSWGRADTDQLIDMDVNEIRQQQQQIMREQDQGLESLSHVLGRQKQMAIDMGNEVDYQNELIDDIHDHVDRTDQRLIQETRHIRIVDRKSGTCGLWVVIILLFVAIVVIAVIPV